MYNHPLLSLKAVISVLHQGKLLIKLALYYHSVGSMNSSSSLPASRSPPHSVIGGMPSDESLGGHL